MERSCASINVMLQIKTCPYPVLFMNPHDKDYSMKFVTLKFILLTAVFSFAQACQNSSNKGAELSEEISPIENLNKAVESSRGAPDQLYQRAEYLFEQGQFDEAIADVFLIFQKDSNHLRGHELLADIYMETYRSQMALRTLQRATEVYPDSLDTKLKLAEYQLILKQYDASVATIGEVLQKDAQNANALFYLGLNFQEQGDRDRAIGAFQSAVEIDPDLIDAWIILGNYMEQLGSPLAAQYYDNAVRVDPQNISALHSKAYYLQNHDQIDEALELYEQIQSIDPTYADAYLNSGILYILMDNVDEGIAQLNKLVRIDSTNELAHFYLGRSFELKQDIEAAKAAYRAALKWSPSMQRAREALDLLELEG